MRPRRTLTPPCNSPFRGVPIRFNEAGRCSASFVLRSQPTKRGASPMPNKYEVEALALSLIVKFDLCQFDFQFNRRRRAVGMCFFPTPTTRGRIEVSECFLDLLTIDELEDTIRHEL